MNPNLKHFLPKNMALYFFFSNLGNIGKGEPRLTSETLGNICFLVAAKNVMEAFMLHFFNG